MPPNEALRAPAVLATRGLFRLTAKPIGLKKGALEGGLLAQSRPPASRCCKQRTGQRRGIITRPYLFPQQHSPPMCANE